MNNIDKKPNYKEIYSFITTQYNKTTHFQHGPYDETYYSLRVYETAKEIMRKLKKKVNKEQVLVASLLHDIGKTKLKASKIFGKNKLLDNAFQEWTKHAQLSVPIAKKFLKQQGHSDEFIKEVCYLIEKHDSRKDKLKNKSIELQILQDADLIADIGVAGFIRPFLFCGKFNTQSIVGAIKYIQKEGIKSKCDEINLTESKIIEKRELKTQTDLIKKTVKDIKSDLL